MKIFIKEYNEETFTLDVEPSDSVDSLKKKIAEKKNCHIEHVGLRFDKILNKGILSDYNIQNESTISLSMLEIYIYENN